MDYGCTELYVEIRAQLWLMLFSSDYFSKMLTRKKIRYKTNKNMRQFGVANEIKTLFMSDVQAILGPWGLEC